MVSAGAACNGLDKGHANTCENARPALASHITRVDRILPCRSVCNSQCLHINTNAVRGRYLVVPRIRRSDSSSSYPCTSSSGPAVFSNATKAPEARPSSCTPAPCLGLRARCKHHPCFHASAAYVLGYRDWSGEPPSRANSKWSS
jgi:hypothetical protein